MEKALNYILINNAALVALVDGHISPIKRDDVPKSVTYELSGGQSSTFASGKTSNMRTSEFAIIARALSYKDAKAISDAIKTALKDIRGIYDGKKIHLCLFTNEQQNQYHEQEISEITLSYTFYHNQPV